MPMTETEIINKLSQSLKYTPVVYKQSLYSTNLNAFGNVFELEYKYTELPEDSLLFFVPSISSNTSGTCKLKIKVPTITNGGEFRYVAHEYNILIEQNDGTTRLATKGDIIAYRLCIFRFTKKSNSIILCNSPLYNDAAFSNLSVTNCNFTNLPTYTDPESSGVTYTLVTTRELNSVLQRLSALENRIKFGVASPEEALADSPTGTIYIQYEED